MAEEKIFADEPIAARGDLGERRASSAVDRVLRRPQGYQRVTPRGGAAEDGDGAKHHSLWRSLILVVFLMGIGAGIYYGTDPLRELLERPLTRVAVEGEFVFVSKTRTSELISAEINDDFLQLDLMRLKQVLEQDPWVERASIGRRWPDTLVVRIVEQKPIARWGDVGFMNQRGEIVTVAEAASQLAHLPLLQGEVSDASLILRQYQDLVRLLRTRGLDVIALKSDAKKSWRMTLAGEVELVIGRDQVMEKIGRFIRVYDRHLKDRWIEVKRVDLRYTNGVAVEWQEEVQTH